MREKWMDLEKATAFCDRRPVNLTWRLCCCSLE